jgi:hypothetical protein
MTFFWWVLLPCALEAAAFEPPEQTRSLWHILATRNVNRHTSLEAVLLEGNKNRIGIKERGGM